MIAIRFHGRGGQGGVIASKLLATALFHEGWQVQAFPSFGAERAGAPVAAFVRADHRRITIHSHIYTPDHVIVLDPTLLKAADVLSGLKPGGWILVNSDVAPQALDLPASFGAATCDATGIALRHGLGTRTSPKVNTAIIGAFAALTGLVWLEHVLDSIPGLVPAKVDANSAAAAEAYELMTTRPSNHVRPAAAEMTLAR